MVEALVDILKGTNVLLGVFLAFYFLRSHENKTHFWLGALLGTLAGHFANLLLIDWLEIPHYGLVFGFIYGPVIYFFTRAHNRDVGKTIFHFLPALVLLAWIVLSRFMAFNTPASELVILQVLVGLHFISYCLLAWKESRNYRDVAVQTRANIEFDKMELITRIILLLGVIFLTGLIASIFEVEGASHLFPFALLVMSLVITLGLFGIIFYGMRYPEKFAVLTDDERQLAAQETRYAQSGLTDQMAKQYIDVLKSYMMKVKPFTRDNLTIADLAHATQIPPRYLSQVLNQNLDQNFFDFINSYRIKEAIELLEDQGLNISEVMYAVGFSSRSSFNTAFRKYVGITPTQYRRAQGKQ